MNIHQSLTEARHKLRGQNTHEAGEHDQVRLRAVDSARQILIKGFSRRVALVVNQGSFNAGVLCMLRPPAPRRLLITSEISPPNDPSRLAFSSDWKFEPRPDSNTATRFVTRVALAES